MSDHPEIRHERSADKGRFWVETDEGVAELTISIVSDALVVADHTGVPRALEGRGLGCALVEALVSDAEARGYLVVPLCPFVAAWARRHPETARVFAAR